MEAGEGRGSDQKTRRRKVWLLTLRKGQSASIACLTLCNLQASVCALRRSPSDVGRSMCLDECKRRAFCIRELTHPKTTAAHLFRCAQAAQRASSTSQA